jgi:hypothetical protein
MTPTGDCNAGSLTLNSQQALTDNWRILAVSGNAVLTAGSISLATAAGETLTIAGNARFSSRTGNITVAAAGQTNFGSLTFDTAGSVQIHEDSPMISSAAVAAVHSRSSRPAQSPIRWHSAPWRP